MSEKMNGGDRILECLVAASAADGMTHPIDTARNIFEFLGALEAEASILGLRRAADTAKDVVREVSDHLERRAFKKAAAVAVAYGSQMGQTPHSVVRPFALRVAQMAEQFGPAQMNAENGTIFCALMTELEDALKNQLVTEVERQSERGAAS